MFQRSNAHSMLWLVAFITAAAGLLLWAALQNSAASGTLIWTLTGPEWTVGAALGAGDDALLRLAAALQRMLLLAAGGCGSVALLWWGLKRIASPAALLLMVGVWSLTLVVLLDVFTNTNASLFGAAFDGYVALAENGFSDPNLLKAPYVYRMTVPLLSGAVARMLDVPSAVGFALVTYAAQVALLMLTWHLMRVLGASLRGAVLGVLVMALSLALTKNNLYFNSAMEPASQALLIGFYLSYRRRWIGVCLLITLIGLLTREFFLITAGFMGWWLLSDLIQRRSTRSAVWLALVIAATGAMVLIPRLLIREIPTELYIDPINNPSGSLAWLVTLPANPVRNLNLLIGLFSFLLPLLMLITPRRLRDLRRHLRGSFAFIGLYSLGVLGLTLYGGTDLYRYVSFLFLPLLIVLAALERPDAAAPTARWEIVWVLAWVFIHNTAAAFIPPADRDLSVYLAFWPAYSDFWSGESVRRLLEMGAALAGVVIVRRGFLR